MRLFRRSLLCLVVGVTAFGAAGWVFRPRATWEVEVLPDAEFVYSANRRESDLIWLCNEYPKDTFIGLSPETGAVRWTIQPPKDFVFMRVTTPLSQGRFLTRAHVPDTEDATKSLRTWLAVVDPKGLTFERQWTFEGQWEPTSTGDRAWQIVAIPGGFKLKVRRLSDGKLQELSFGPGYGGFEPAAYRQTKFANVEVAPDGKTLVVCEWIKDQRGDGFEIWNVEEGKLLGRHALPAKRSIKEPLRAAGPQFLDDRVVRVYGDLASGEMRPFEKWDFDVERREYLNEWNPSPPPSELPVVMQDQKTPSGAAIWTAYQRGGGPFAWFGVFRGEQQIREWRKVPFHYITEPYIGIDHGYDYGMNVYSVPGRDEFIARIWSPPLSELLPAQLHDFAGKYLDIHNSLERHYWHDWHSSRWIDVGCREKGVSFQIRFNAYLTIQEKGDDEKRVLQSWPLPPRDPKWPALGVAIACAAGTWWTCGWRYRRRMKRTTPAAVTA